MLGQENIKLNVDKYLEIPKDKLNHPNQCKASDNVKSNKEAATQREKLDLSKKLSKIGDVSFDNPFFLAPLAGITDSPFRQICKEFGCGAVYSEMISVNGLYYNDKGTEKLLAYDSLEEPIAFQIFGSDPAMMAVATEKLESKGNAFLDINMGCPVPKVVRNNSGSALLKDITLAVSIVEAVKKNTKKPVTVKIRIGWDEKSINCVEMAKAMEAEGADAIAVHGRTRDQYYSGVANWDMIRLVKESVKIPVIGNGDVFSGKDGLDMMNYTGCDFVMIGRGALGHPWIFEELLREYHGEDQEDVRAKYANPAEALAIANKQFNLALALKGEYIAIREMRKHVGWYVKGFKGAAAMRQHVNKLSTKEEMNDFLTFQGY